ncbi:hypothetical protein A2U01_0042981, partial [Trifolium medium]|nr:hypothetical protein [Trifolium medium]
DDLVNHVCNAYKGPLKIKACQRKESDIGEQHI